VAGSSVISPDPGNNKDVEADLTGRSLTMREYLDAVLTWVDRHYEPRTSLDADARLRDLREHIQAVEARTLLRRFGAGEEWRIIKASTRGGRLA
jgi:hypothetical protein